MYEAKVLADSISPGGVRLTTVQATFPRFILAEVNTHRVFSRNSASSRAIPPEKLIERVESDPFVPETFNKRVKGMGVGATIEEEAATAARSTWLFARDEAVHSARRLNAIGIDKSRINRLLEPFMWHTAIISSTKWDNYFSLRCPPGPEATIDFPAQLEFQKIAVMMRDVMNASVPLQLVYGDWHLPLVSGDEGIELQDDPLFWPRVSAGRCARVSFDTHENYEEPIKSWERQTKTLENNGHLSPAEHPARPVTKDEFAARKNTGNFTGWVQLRKLIPFEENLVGFVEERGHWEDEPI